MKKLILSLGLLCFITQMYSQITKLPEVVITAVNYKYINAVDTEDTDVSVKMLEEQVAMYDLKDSDLYNDEYDIYRISFFIPEGKIVAAYDKNGKIIRTIEKFNNVKLPISVIKAISQRFPNWSLAKNVYSVIYHENNAKVKKQYKVKLENGDKVMRLTLDENGDSI